MFRLTVESQFSAAHQIRGHAGLSGRVHGHNYRVIVHVAGETLNELGMLIDYTVLKDAVTCVTGQFEHECLNDVPALHPKQPTSEVLAQRIFQLVQQELSALTDPGQSSLWVDEVVVFESEKQAVSYRKSAAA